MPAATSEPKAAVSVIVPVSRDTDGARNLFENARRWRPPPREIVVVSAEADPELAALCAAHGHRCLAVDAPNRGAQLDLGARSAAGSILWFLHADCTAPDNGVETILRAVEDGAESGCFTFAFHGERTWYKLLIERGVAARLRLGGVAYGDQALFVTRDAYAACGGFPHEPLFEEVRLVKCLRRRGTFRILSERVGVSTRRWERDGWLRRTAQNRWLAFRYALGAPPARLAAAYSRVRVRTDRPSA